jgi:hypothetical protein
MAIEGAPPPQFAGDADFHVLQELSPAHVSSPVLGR